MASETIHLLVACVVYGLVAATFGAVTNERPGWAVLGGAFWPIALALALVGVLLAIAFEAGVGILEWVRKRSKRDGE